MLQKPETAAYFRPDKLEDSLELLARQPMRVVAGATDIYPAQVAQRAWARSSDQSWLDITNVAALGGITESAGGWRIGALATWSDLVRADLPACFDGLKAAAREVGGLQIQNRATLVGNLCNASPAADGVPPLLCLNATVELASASGKRELPLSGFILGNRKIARHTNELVTAVNIPAHQSHSLNSQFFKLGARKYLVISIVMASGLVSWDEQQQITDCRFAVGACSPVATRIPSLEKDLIGISLDDLAGNPKKIAELIGDHHIETLHPIDDVRADAAYRRDAARACLTELLEMHCHHFRGASS